MEILGNIALGIIIVVCILAIVIMAGLNDSDSNLNEGNRIVITIIAMIVLFIIIGTIGYEAGYEAAVKSLSHD